MGDRVDMTSLLAGLLFVGLGVLFLLDEAGAIDFEVRWVWPALLIGLGVAWLASSRTSEPPPRTRDEFDEADQV